MKKKILQDIVSGDVINMKYQSDRAPKEMRNTKVPYAPRERGPNEALPWLINKMEGKHTPQPWPDARPGADDHKQYKSRGV